jgi:hypothetical protein
MYEFQAEVSRSRASWTHNSHRQPLLGIEKAQASKYSSFNVPLVPSVRNRNSHYHRIHHYVPVHKMIL